MSSGKNSDERNPFAPPPADAPDRPWQPRLPQGPVDGEPQGEEGAAPESGRPAQPPVPPPHSWSPNWQGGGGPGWPGPQSGPPQPRFDPADPVHRRSRYALYAGMGSLSSGLFGYFDFSLLFGVLALYWGVSTLRATRKDAAASAGREEGAQPGAPSWPYSQRVAPQVPAALGGLITGGVAVALVLGSFGLEMAYQPYFTCQNDALTQVAADSCSTLAPHWLNTVFDPQN
ncbi:hypothetical protein C7C46_17405 [Streptomyces tateyamensis]|uniref:Uncharacterized protein n=1 Tax=Streptomyces tateyamensis TaxID=565073 RepID=A0A2V4NQ73_9ACTN|nr:hypothetical protein [Streptomyces tateyamensis]PYC78105.1 hypothetical protein C7C46_17405 [Streptomyces tateyamensis]